MLRYIGLHETHPPHTWHRCTCEAKHIMHSQAHTSLHTPTHTHLYKNTHTYTHTHAHNTQRHTHTRAHTTYTHINTQTYAQTQHTYTHAHTHTHTHTHAHTHVTYTVDIHAETIHACRCRTNRHYPRIILHIIILQFIPTKCHRYLYAYYTFINIMEVTYKLHKQYHNYFDKMARCVVFHETIWSWHELWIWNYICINHLHCSISVILLYWMFKGIVIVKYKRHNSTGSELDLYDSTAPYFLLCDRNKIPHNSGRRCLFILLLLDFVRGTVPHQNFKSNARSVVNLRTWTAVLYTFSLASVGVGSL